MHPVELLNSFISWTSSAEAEENIFEETLPAIMTVASVAMGAVVVVDKLLKIKQSLVDSRHLSFKQREFATKVLEDMRGVEEPENAWGQQFSKLIKIMHEKSSQSKDIWQDGEVIEATDLLIKLAYVASIRLLDNRHGQPISRADSIVLFYLPVSYHAARGYCTTQTGKNDWGKNLMFGLYIPEDKIPIYHSRLFYIDGIYNEWRLLFNQYSLDLQEKIPDMCNESRLAAWIKPDLDAGQFNPIPDTLPETDRFVVPALDDQEGESSDLIF